MPLVSGFNRIALKIGWVPDVISLPDRIAIRDATAVLFYGHDV